MTGDNNHLNMDTCAACNEYKYIEQDGTCPTCLGHPVNPPQKTPLPKFIAQFLLGITLFGLKSAALIIRAVLGSIFLLTPVVITTHLGFGVYAQTLALVIAFITLLLILTLWSDRYKRYNH